MKALSQAAAFCGLTLTSIIFSAAHERPPRPELETITSLYPNGSWAHTFEQYSWPEGQNVLFNPNCREADKKRDWTPLHVAVHHGYSKIVKVLLNNGALVLQDAHGKFPHEIELHPDAAERYADYIDAQKLVCDMRQNGLLVFIAGEKYFEKIWATHDFATNPNIRDTLPTGSYASGLHSQHYTALHGAIAYGDVPFTQELLKHGALLLRDKSGLLPHKITGVCNIDNKQARFLARFAFKMLNPMHIAAIDYNTYMIKELAKINHTYVHTPDQFGRTPLIYSVQSHAYRDQEKHTDDDLLAVVKALTQYGSKVGLEDAFGKSAYNYYAESNSTSEVREELLELLK